MPHTITEGLDEWMQFLIGSDPFHIIHVVIHGCFYDSIGRHTCQPIIRIFYCTMTTKLSHLSYERFGLVQDEREVVLNLKGVEKFR